jgi:hypothetical protein
MLDNSPIPEPLKETLLFSPLVKDKLFGLPLGKLQEKVSKTPPTVKVDVQVSNEQRRVTTSQSHSETDPTPLSLSKEPEAAMKCPAVPRTLYINLRLLSDLAQVDWSKAIPSTGLSPIRKSMFYHRTDTLYPEKNHE